jgi:hypothetical protein
MYSSPHTPSPSHSSDHWLSYQPHLSSPLADVQARRRSQYKSCTRRAQSSSSSTATPLPGLTRRSLSAETPQKAFLRERFQANCVERVERKRERRRRARSVSGSEGSSDGMDDVMDCEDEVEDDDRIMQDEVSCCCLMVGAVLFDRITGVAVIQTHRRQCQTPKKTRVSTFVFL